MATLNRRDFLRSTAVASSAVAAGCNSLTYDPKTPQENILPYTTMEDDMLPGTAQSYATACTACASGCGIVARNKEGRVVSVSANPDNPTANGLCVRGHMGLLETYSPDRFGGPMNAGQPATWDDTLAAVNAAVAAARGAGKSVAWLGQYRTGSLGRLLDDLGVGIGLRRVHWEPLGVESLLAASRATFGKNTLPSYDLSGARTILSFGMEFLSTALDSMHMIRGWARARDPKDGGFVARYVAVEPRVGHTSAQADHFLPATPGTEAQVAMAIARLVADKAHYSGPAAALLAGVDVAAAASASGIAQEKLEQIAGWLTEAPSVVLPGGAATAGADATALAIASFLINEAAGNVGRSVVFGRELSPGPVSSYADVKALLEDARSGKVGVLFVDGLDPVYNLPTGDQVGAALDAVDTLVVFANEANDSTRQKAIVLPTGSNLETWGDVAVVAGYHTLQQPAMVALKDSRAIGDVLLAIGKAAAPDQASTFTVPFPAGATITLTSDGTSQEVTPVGPMTVPAFQAADFATYVKERWRREIFPASGASDFDAFWVTSQQRGGFFQDLAAVGAPVVLSAAPTTGGFPAGAEAALVVFPSPSLHDGRHANRPWAQELPDPISTYNWSTWAELSPGTVSRLGLREGDMVKIENANGSIEVGFFESRGVPDNVVAVVLGNGHESSGRYAKGRGANPMKLVASATDAQSGALALYSSRVTVSRASGDSKLLTFSGNIDQDGRPIALNCTVDAALAGGEAGAAVVLHELPVDERLTKEGLTDMFPEPQHPTYRFAMAIDLNGCTGCMACVAACNLENNIPFVGPDQAYRGRMMSWIRMDRFWEGEGEHQDVRHLPALCQHCSHAPCEGVCPVLATYHNLDGLNAMVYNRCVGTRYCANNCPYTARRFNYHTWQWPESMHLMLNPDVMAREMGVMEKCTFCVQKLRAAKDTWRDEHKTVPAEALQRITACAAACPSGAITFGNAKDDAGALHDKWNDPRVYTLLGELNTKPGVRYLARASYAAVAAHGEGHAAGAPAEGTEGHAPAHHEEG